MTNDQRTETHTPDPNVDPTRTEGLDPGAFVGQRPERQAASIPGGIGPAAERIAANSTQTSDTDAPRDQDERGPGQER